MRLGLFFTKGISFEHWKKSGFLGRELEYYRYLSQIGGITFIRFFVYGETSQKIKEEIERDLQGIEFDVINIKGSILRFLLYLVFHKFKIKDLDIIKCNQMNGIMPAILASTFYSIPLFARSGYVPSKYLSERGKLSASKRIYHHLNEKLLSMFADRISVSSEHDYQYFIKKYLTSASKIRKIANFVIVPKLIDDGREQAFVFVGRLEAEKNVINLVKAFNRLSISLVIIGQGSLKETIQNISGPNIFYKGVMEHHCLLSELVKYEYFILPSIVEGMPKVLIEAMSLGCFCIGSPTPGIKEIIDDTGLGLVMSGYSEEDIFNSVSQVIENSYESTDKNLIDQSLSKYSLSSIANSEVELLNDLYKNTTTK